MFSRDIHPKWWQLYIILPLLIVFFAVDSRLKISEHGHQAVQIGIILVFYGLIHLWLRANATALSKLDQQQYPGRVTVIEIPPYHLSEKDRGPMFHLPDAEITGLLSDTLDMDYLDAEFSPIDEVSQESNKE